jgi:septal ring-binding cell division protein DamX
LVEDPRPQTAAPPPATPQDDAARLPKKGRKRRKQAQARREKEQGKEQGKQGKSGHVKKVKAKVRLTAELGRLDSALMQLRERVADLHGLQLDQEETGAALGQRLEQLAARAESPPPGLPPALGERLHRLELALTQGPSAPALAAIDERLVAIRVELAAQAERLGRAELALADPPGAPAGSDQAPWQGELSGLRAELDERVCGLAGDLGRQADQAAKRREVDQCWTDSRLRRLGRHQSLALVGLGLLAALLVGASWWRTGDRLERADSRLSTLERQAAAPRAAESAPTPAPAAPVADQLAGLQSTVERIHARLEGLGSQTAQAPAQSAAALPAGLPEDLLARLRQVESDLKAQTGELAAGRRQGEALESRQAELVAAERQLLERLDGVQRTLAETDKGLAVLAERMESRDARPLAAAPDSDRAAQSSPEVPPAAGAPAGPVEPAPAVLESPAYGVQLVAYGSRERIGPFLKEYGVGEAVVALEVVAAGRPAQAVLIGPFASESEAAGRLAGLPARLRALGPWVRPLPAGSRLDPAP